MMKLIFEQSVTGRGLHLLPACDVPSGAPARRPCAQESPPHLPEIAKADSARHYTALCKQVHGVN